MLCAFLQMSQDQRKNNLSFSNFANIPRMLSNPSLSRNAFSRNIETRWLNQTCRLFCSRPQGGIVINSGGTLQGNSKQIAKRRRRRRALGNVWKIALLERRLQSRIRAGEKGIENYILSLAKYFVGLLL